MAKLNTTPTPKFRAALRTDALVTARASGSILNAIGENVMTAFDARTAKQGSRDKEVAK